MHNYTLLTGRRHNNELAVVPGLPCSVHILTRYTHAQMPRAECIITIINSFISLASQPSSAPTQLPGPLTLFFCLPASGLLNSFSPQSLSPSALPSLALHDHTERTCLASLALHDHTERTCLASLA